MKLEQATARKEATDNKVKREASRTMRKTLAAAGITTLRIATHGPGAEQIRHWRRNMAIAQDNEKARQRASRALKLSLQAAERTVKDDKTVTAWQRSRHKSLAATEVSYHPSIEGVYMAAVKRASETRAEGNWRKDFDSGVELRRIRYSDIVGITLGEASRYPPGSQERDW